MAHAGELTQSSLPLPLYHQVLTILRQRISDGTYEASERLPAEEALGAEFGVSRATIRQAIGELAREGSVARKQGKGTFVKPSSAHPVGQRFRGSLADLMRETRRARMRNVRVEANRPISPRIAAMLKVDPPVGTIVRRTRLMDGRIFAYTVNYLPERYGSMLAEKELKETSLMYLLEQKGVKLRTATQSIRAQVADLQVSQELGVGFGAPVLFVERLLLGDRKVPIEVIQSWYRGDVYEYTVTFDLAGRSGEQIGADFA